MSSIDEQRDQLIKEISEHWAATDATLRRVVHFEIPASKVQNERVLLLQVTDATPPSPDEVVAYGFAPSLDFPFPMTIAQVTPDEWERIARGELPLPEGWSLTHKRDVLVHE